LRSRSASGTGRYAVFIRREIVPVSLGNMGEHGEGDLRSLQAREASISVDNLPGDTYVPDVALRLLCSACGSKRITHLPYRV
jgi:hypothetical protein